MTRPRPLTPILWAATGMLLAILLADTLKGQDAMEARERGLVAYRAMDYEAAVRAFRRGLTSGREPLTATARAELLGYIGASEAWRGRPTEAATAFRDALETDPRYRADTLVFPEAITATFEEVRRSTAFVDITTAPDTLIRIGKDRARFTIHVSAPHAVRLDVCAIDGGVLKRLSEGTVVDSALATWDGMDARGMHPLAGDLALCAESETAQGITRRLLRHLEVDILAEPGATPVREARRPNRRRAIVAGVIAGLVTFALPSLVSRDERGTDGRFVLGSVLVGASVAATQFPRATILRDSVRAPRRAPGSVRVRILVRPVSQGRGEP